MTSASSLSAERSAELESAIARVARSVLAGAPKRLEEAVLYSLLGPGKRYRPRIVLAVGAALEVPFEIGSTLAAALEMTHAYTLIHDDLPAMDDDDIRRGRPTNHKIYGEGLAILAGDSLALSGPETLLSLRNRIPADRVLDLVAEVLFVAGARGVIAGQAAEMDLKGLPSTNDVDSLYEVFRKKTGALFRAAVTLPAIAAGSDAKLIEVLRNQAENFGVAFQIADDLEDDFSAKKTDPTHVARYLSPEKARSEATARLVLDESLPPKIRLALAPFFDECRKKLDRSSA